MDLILCMPHACATSKRFCGNYYLKKKLLLLVRERIETNSVNYYLILGKLLLLDK